MSGAWYYADHKGLIGPITLQELKNTLAGRSEPENMLVWRDGLTNWVRAGDVPEFWSQTSPPGRIKVVEDAKRRRWLRPLGFCGRLLTYAALFLLLYIWAPNDISKKPLATLTLSDIAGTIFFILIGLALVRALFQPSDDDQIKDAWGWVGVVLLGIVGIGALYLYNAR